jgi:hypothetical protein
MPTLNQVETRHLEALWLVFQHASVNKYRKDYLPYFQEAAERGELPYSRIALMQDRTLMMEGEPQVYGSQVRASGPNGEYELWELSDPEYVDQRRAAIGLKPLNDYLRFWRIEFDIPQKQK